MTAPPTPFNSGDPVNIGFGGATVTLVEGATFCLSDGRGDVLAGRSHGLFVRDARVLSRVELRVDGQPAEPLSVQAPEPFVAKFILRRSPRAGLADSTLLLVRERLIADGLRETISLHNLDDEHRGGADAARRRRLRGSVLGQGRSGAAGRCGHDGAG